MRQYRKRPVVIEAEQFDGTGDSAQRLCNWGGGAIEAMLANPDGSTTVPQLAIAMREGTMLAKPGDWIIKGVAGEFYPCQDAIFQVSYEPVAEPKAEPVGRPLARPGWQQK